MGSAPLHCVCVIGGAVQQWDKHQLMQQPSGREKCTPQDFAHKPKAVSKNTTAMSEAKPVEAPPSLSPSLPPSFPPSLPPNFPSFFLPSSFASFFPGLFPPLKSSCVPNRKSHNVLLVQAAQPWSQRLGVPHGAVRVPIKPQQLAHTMAGGSVLILRGN